MHQRISRAVLAFAMLTACSSVSLQANAITNGSFESPLVPAGGFTDFASGSSAIPGWTVVGAAGGVSIISGTNTQPCCSFPAEDGAQFLDLTGDGTNAVEGVEQTISTAAGTNYTLTFWVGNLDNPSNGLGPTSTVNVNLGGLNGTLLDSVTNSSTNSTTLTWEMFTTSFTAAASTTTLDFLNENPSNNNINGLDNVSVNVTSAVPEPGSIALLGAALGVLGFWSRKRTCRG
jgi:choice-of-anchor C domain-containing protein